MTFEQVAAHFPEQNEAWCRRLAVICDLPSWPRKQAALHAWQQEAAGLATPPTAPQHEHCGLCGAWGQSPHCKNPHCHWYPVPATELSAGMKKAAPLPEHSYRLGAVRLSPVWEEAASNPGGPATADDSPISPVRAGSDIETAGKTADGRERPATYYPRTFGGEPPYCSVNARQTKCVLCGQWGANRHVTTRTYRGRVHLTCYERDALAKTAPPPAPSKDLLQGSLFDLLEA